MFITRTQFQQACEAFIRKYETEHSVNDFTGRSRQGWRWHQHPVRHNRLLCHPMRLNALSLDCTWTRVYGPRGMRFKTGRQHVWVLLSA